MNNFELRDPHADEYCIRCGAGTDAGRWMHPLPSAEDGATLCDLCLDTLQKESVGESESESISTEVTVNLACSECGFSETPTTADVPLDESELLNFHCPDCGAMTLIHGDADEGDTTPDSESVLIQHPDGSIALTDEEWATLREIVDVLGKDNPLGAQIRLPAQSGERHSMQSLRAAFEGVEGEV